MHYALLFDIYNGFELWPVSVQNLHSELLYFNTDVHLSILNQFY